MTKENNTLSLNSLTNDGTKSNRKRVEEALVLVMVKQLEEVIRVKNLGLEDLYLDGLKVDKCHFSKDYQNLVFLLE